MTSAHRAPSRSIVLLRWFVVAVAYVLAGRLGLTLAFVNASASAVFPASGLALAVLVLWGTEMWSAILVGAFLVNILTSGLVAESFAVAGGNTVAAVVGAFLARRVASAPDSFNTVPDVCRFVGVACVLDACVAATNGVTTLCLFGLAQWSNFAVIWLTWWLGDAAGAILVAPLILLWARTSFAPYSTTRGLELVALSAAVALNGWVSFFVTTYPIEFVSLGLCVWAALRFGQREAVTVACVLAGIAISGTLAGHGTFGVYSPVEALWLLQAFMAFCVVMALLTGASAAERRAAEATLHTLNQQLGARVRERTAELEAALEGVTNSEARLAAAQQLGHIGSWEWNAEDNTEYWSDELYRLCGYEPGSFAPTLDAFMKATPEDERPNIQRTIDRALEDHQPFRIEHRFRRPDGGVRVFFSEGRTVVDDSGRVVKMTGATQDITARKAAEEVVRRSERRLQTIIQAQPACMKVVSPEGCVIEMNAAGLRMLGAASPAEVVNRRVVDLVHPDDRDRYLALHRAASNGTPGRLEFRIVRFDGAERWVDSHAVPFDTPDEAHGQRNVLSVTTDTTDSKRLEQQLRQSQKMEAVGLLAGGVAHDFNNLLVPIGGYTELVMMSLDENDSRRAELLEVRKASERAAALTRQLLAFSRRQVLQPRVLDANALIGGIYKLLHRTIPERVAITLNLDGRVEPIKADPGQLEQVLVNLALNAADAMPDGGDLRIASAVVDMDQRAARLRSPMAPGRYVKLTVSDTGTGMSAETQARIFEPFFTTKEPGRGTGLGLATVYGIVKQSGGYIWVTSVEGQGTSFDVFLPVAPGPIDAELELTSQAEIVGGTETILVAEDESAVRQLASDVLRRYGYTVLTARDGDEALLIATTYERDIHLLVTDMVMPGLSGTSLARRVYEVRPHMRVLYSSGYTEYMSGKPPGLNASLPFLAKPYAPTTLLRKVRDVLDTSSRATVHVPAE